MSRLFAVWLAVFAVFMMALWGAEELRHMFMRGPVIKMHGFFAWDEDNHQCVEFKQVENGTAYFVTREDLQTERACKP